MKSRDAFALLANDDRRHALRVLVENEGTATVEELAERIAGRFEEATADQARTALVHNHLPKLEDAGAVERGNGVVVLTGEGAELEPLLEAAAELDERPSELTLPC